MLFSVLAAGAFYLFFAAISGFVHPFLNLLLFPVFIGSVIVLSMAAYALSYRARAGGKEKLLLRVRNGALIVLSALVLSAVFPAAAFQGFYPIRMAMFHLLILFYAGLSLGAVSTAWAVFLWRDGAPLTLFNRYVFFVVVLFSLGMSYATIFMFGLLPAG